MRTLGSSNSQQPSYVREQPIHPGEHNIVTMPKTMKRQPVQTKKKVADTSSDFEPTIIKWTDDYNIIEVHEHVLNYLKTKNESRDKISKQIVTLENSFKPGMSVDKITHVRATIDKLKRDLAKFKPGLEMEYGSRVNLLVSEYRKLSEKVAVIMGRKTEESDDNIARKTKIVEEYLEIASEFAPMSIRKETKMSKICVCGGFITDDGDRFMCSECQRVYTKMDNCEEYTEQEGYSKRPNTDNGSNFKDVVLQHQVAYPVNIPDRILNDIKRELSKYTNLSLATLSRIDLVLIMKSLNMGTWYKHLNKIYFMLTEKMPADISRYANNVIKRGELLNEVFPSVKEEGRTNFMHNLHILWLLLKNEGCEPDMNDFILLKSRDVEIANIATLKRAFEILNRTHPEFSWVIYEIK